MTRESVSTAFVVSSDNTDGDVEWTNPIQARILNSNYAYCDISPSQTSEWLKALDWRFYVPNAAIIEGIKLEVDVETDTTSSIQALAIRLVEGGVIQSQNKTFDTLLWPTTFDYYEAGGSDDTWDKSYVGNDVNASDWGIALRVENVSGVTAQARVRYLRVTIYWSLDDVFFTTGSVAIG